MKNSITSVLSIATTSFGQNKKLSELTNNKYTYQNLIKCIKSENKQIRKNSIYLEGYYRIIESKNELIKQLRVEECFENKILIGLALYKINSEKGIKELMSLAQRENNVKLKKMCYAICTEYLSSYAKSI